LKLFFLMIKKFLLFQIFALTTTVINKKVKCVI
jgi:hypothetical protein